MRLTDLIGPVHRDEWIAAQARQVEQADQLDPLTAHRLVCWRIRDEDARLLATEGQVWVRRDPDDGDRPAQLWIVARIPYGPTGPQLTVEEPRGRRCTVPVEFLAHYRLDHWWWAE